VRNFFHLLFPLFAPLTLLGCQDRPPPIDPPVPDSCADVTHPLDSALCAELYDTGYRPLIAGGDELCTRLFVDLTGVRPTPDQLREQCIGRPLADVIAQLQSTERYRKAQRRYWADRLSYSDALVDPISIKKLDQLVDDLYQNKINYRDFAINALAHPGFVGRHNGYGQPDLTAQAAFRAFLGRPATRPEALDVGNLWRPWAANYFREDFAKGAEADLRAPYYGMGGEPFIDPQACADGVNLCESSLLGRANVAFPAHGRIEQIRIADLTGEQWEALRTPGRLFVALDAFWEAQVDDTLEKLLGYDLGAMRPAARQALVDRFQQNGGDVRELERMILTSWTYRQTAEEIAGSPRPEALRLSPLAYGPTKLLIAEAWMQSIGLVVGRPMGDCDWRYPNLPDYGLTPDQLPELEDFYPRNADGTVDASFRNAARLVGGCPGSFDYGSNSVTGRTKHIGLITAVAQEEELVEICFLGDVPALMPAGISRTDTSVESLEATARHVMSRFQVDPRDPDIAEIIDTVVADCADCDVEAVARGLCSGLLGGVEFLTY
jgi:hypothetical protein